MLSIELPKDVCKQIQAIPFSLNSNSEDVSCWAYSKDGPFSLKFAYLLAKGLNPLNPSSISGEWIWKASTTLRIMFFLWLCWDNNVPTCEVLGLRCFILDSTCPICNKEVESLYHILKDPF